MKMTDLVLREISLEKVREKRNFWESICQRKIVETALKGWRKSTILSRINIIYFKYYILIADLLKSLNYISVLQLELIYFNYVCHCKLSHPLYSNLKYVKSYVHNFIFLYYHQVKIWITKTYIILKTIPHLMIFFHTHCCKLSNRLSRRYSVIFHTKVWK